MPPQLLIDLNQVDLTHSVMDSGRIYGEFLPHRFEFELLDGLCYLDRESLKAVAYRDIQPDDWYFRGHIPGRPILPGIVMLETAAQLAALLGRITTGYDQFVAFGGVEDCKFRLAVTPPARLYLLARGIEHRPRRIVSATQAVVDGALVFEAKITGMPLP